MKKSIYVLPFIAWLCASACGPSIPSPNDSDSTKAAKCEKVSQDQTLGCKACAGFAFCGWTQTTDPTTGTCGFVKDVTAPPPGMIADPTLCPKPE